MRIGALALILSLATSACVEDTVDRTAAKRALDEVSVATLAQTLVAGFAETAATESSGATPEARAVELASNVDALLNCGAVDIVALDCDSAEDCCNAHEGAGCSNTACAALVCTTAPACCESTWSATCASAAPGVCDGTVVSLTMPEDGCSIRERTLSGGLTIDVGDDPVGAKLNWHEVTDGGVTLSGATTVNWSDGDNREVSHVGTLALNADNSSPYRFQDAWTQTPTEGGVQVVDASRCSVLDSKDVDCWTVEGAETCTALEVDCRHMMSSGVELAWSLPVPVAGTNSVELMTTGRQRRVELTYTRESSSSVHVNAVVWNLEDEEPRSTLTFDVHLQ